MAEMLFVADTLDFTEEQGDTFRVQLQWLDEHETRVPLVGYDAVMQLRSSADSADVVHELSVTNGGIVLEDATGSETITLFISAVDTAAITAGTYKYDLEMVDADANVTKIIKGKFKLVAEVTK